MLLNIMFSVIILILFFYIRRYKKEINYISNQIEKNKGEYINIYTKATSNSIEKLVTRINYLYDSSQRIQAENKRIEEELRKSIANISHDLRTPLTSIIGYVELLKDESISKEEKQKYIEIIDRRSKNLEELISSFYDLSRISSNEFNFHLEKINLKDILCDSIAVSYNDFINNNIEPIIKIDNNISDIISDEKLVKRIFANLIGNILKHGARNVIIALHEEKDYIVSSFINYAPLLNEEDAKRIFERFYTADKSRGDRNTGLGLAIVKEISERLGNKISSRLIDGNLNIEIKWKK